MSLREATWSSSVVAPAAAGLATLCASTALTGVIKGGTWFGHILVAVLLIGCTGLALRSLRAPALAVGFAQLVVLLFLVTGMYTSHGILGIVPGPAAFAELNDVLVAAGDDIRTGLPPVDASTAILCLATIGIGLVAVVVDTLAVALAAPAAAGLVLLCLYAVPASLADEMLPWWTFALGAAAFAVLIAVDGNHRHRQWRGRSPGGDRSPVAASPPTAVVGAALALGLLAGGTITGIGTVGQLPFVDEGSSRTFSGGLGLEPFTELEGLLNDQGSTEIFRVEGLGEDKHLLRAFTLDTYQPGVGWKIHEGPMPAGTPTTEPELPRASALKNKPISSVRIDPINWRDVWLPIYGAPKRIDGVGGGWYFDDISGAVYSENPQRPGPYRLETTLAQPTGRQLQSAPPAPDEVNPIYTELPQIDPRVQQLTDDVVKGKDTPFEKAKALWEYFTKDGGFVYDTETGGDSDTDALTHFLLQGKRGFCAQFASSMAVMLRDQGIPARVAIGFTAGTNTGNYRSIGTQDAHAWVEVYFGKRYGWVAFDPTPLDGGRGFTPPYLNQQEQNQTEQSQTSQNPSEAPSSAPTNTRPPEGVEAAGPQSGGTAETSLAQAPGWARWSTIFVVLLAAAATAMAVLVARRTSEMRGRAAELDEAGVRLSAASRWLPILTAAGWLLSLGLLGWMVSWWLALALVMLAAILSAPALIRVVSRNRRLDDITMKRPNAAVAAWRELLDELADRENPINEADTVRETARRIAAEYQLDDEGRAHLSTVVAVLERSWYSPDAEVDGEFAAAFEGLRRSLNKYAPLPLKGKLMPTSVLKR